MPTNIQPPKCILELLTYPNPKVTHVPREKKSKSNTHNRRWHTPKVICEWKELETDKPLRKAFNTRLHKAAKLPRQLGSYPFTFPNSNLKNEKDTTHIITQWSVLVVNAALEPIKHEFRPAFWTSVGEQPVDKKGEEPPHPTGGARVQPDREARPKRVLKQEQKPVSYFPDDGAQSIAASDVSTSSDEIRMMSQVERFPKEYKPSQKWKFADAAKLIKPDGKLHKYAKVHNNFWPIRQIFTYCLQFECRYGCLLTCHEAVIFRIQPVSDMPDNDDQSEKHLLETVRRDGKMEYVCIPWANHRRGNATTGSGWTINLVLWYLHILAGNDYKIRWKYRSLVDETLLTSTEITPLSPPSTSSTLDIASEEDHEAHRSTSRDENDGSDRGKSDRSDSDGSDATDSDSSEEENLESGLVGYPTDPLASSFQESVGSRKRAWGEEDSDVTRDGTLEAAGQPFTCSRAKKLRGT